jgi:hypothetical protein
MNRILLIFVLLGSIANIASANDEASDPFAGPWNKVISCGNNLVIDVNSFSSYQLVLKNELANQFSSLRSRNENNNNEVIVGRLVYYGPNGCSIPEMFKESFVEWNSIGNSSIKITGDHSLRVTIRNGHQQVSEELYDCFIPVWMHGRLR